MISHTADAQPAPFENIELLAVGVEDVQVPVQEGGKEALQPAITLLDELLAGPEDDPELRSGQLSNLGMCLRC